MFNPIGTNATNVMKKLYGQEIYTPHKVQKQFHKSKAKWRLLIMGRQAGKTFSACQEAFKMAMSIPNGRGWILAPDDKTCDIAWGAFLKILEKLPTKVVKDHNKSKNIITLCNGHTILKKSAHNPDSLVGDTLDWIWIDEAAIISQAAWELTIPTLFVKDARVIITTTPRGKNWVYDIYKQCLDPNEKDYKFFHCSSYDNPYIKNETIDKTYKANLPEQKFREEILAEFLDGHSAVFNDVRKIAIGTYEPYNPSNKYVMGVDLAKNHDFTVITVINAITGNVAYWKRFTGMAWDKQIQFVVKIAQRYDADVLMDSTGVGEPIYDAVKKLHRKTEGLKFSNSSKQKLIENLILNIEKSEITIPNMKKHKDAAQIVYELEAYESEVTSSGNIKYNAPQREGFYDDCVISLALAVWKLRKKQATVWSF